MTKNTTSSGRPKALIVVSSANALPLANPTGQSISSGWFLVELAAVMARFEETHDFMLATPDGKVPTLDINGMALAMHGGTRLGSHTARLTVQAVALRFDPLRIRERNPDLVARRESELSLLRRQLGRMPVTKNLPKTDREAAAFLDDLSNNLADQPEKHWHSVRELIARHRDASDDFSLADLDFMYAPGGHAPMVDFHDNPVIGELLNTLHENDVPIGLICHAPIAMTSAKYRLDADGEVAVNEDHAFKGARVTTVPKRGELMMLRGGYPKIPGKRTRLPFYVDVALKKAGYHVALTLNPSAPKVVWDAKHNLLTGNGPQSVDLQADRLVEILRHRSTR
ncbi:hypothetical protein L5G28_02000 [Gordonia sp. HY285]|uniref:hypothetical protein n=1 Tax=Gordonia liuliyuniae TaxID=2911517 RepID=UPI001F464C22|nr:hypothetical protein [Gordonia liuliyuniae]MCF8608938.1 hypothetical protein [Gordonia liuliyuniae]